MEKGGKVSVNKKSNNKLVERLIPVLVCSYPLHWISYRDCVLVIVQHRYTYCICSVFIKQYNLLHLFIQQYDLLHLLIRPYQLPVIN